VRSAAICTTFPCGQAQGWAWVIGDVSGKGIPAALFMTVAKTLLKATALKGIPTDTCMETVNRVLVDESLNRRVRCKLSDSDQLGRVQHLRQNRFDIAVHRPARLALHTVRRNP
jgi:hypothetical protein